MSAFEDYQPASFRGVSFLVPSESEDSGQKNVSHEYPNSDERFVEQLGRIPSTFKMDGILHGDNVIQDRIRLKEALNTQGIGDLVHPIYGTIRVKALPFSIRSSQKSGGEAVFSLEFAVSKENITPTPSEATAQSVSQASADAIDALNVALEVNFQEPDRGSLLDSSATKTQDIATDVQLKVNAPTITPTTVRGNVEASLDQVADNSATFNRTANLIIENAFKIAQTPIDMASSMNDLFETALNVADNPSQLSDSWIELLSFGLGIDGITSELNPVNTVKRLLKETNDNLLDEYTRFMVLANLYEATAHTDFTTVPELTEAQSLLDETYTSYLEDAIPLTEDAGLVSIATDANIRQAFLNLKNIAREVMDSKAQTLWKVISINAGRSSMSLTAYKNYGNLDNLDIIKDLNPSVNHAGFNENDLQVVSK